MVFFRTLSHEKEMEMRSLTHIICIAAALLYSSAAHTADNPTEPKAGDSLYIPIFSYRTGSFAGSGIPIADGIRDYLLMLNERDGGIGGIKIKVDECETSYKTDKGIECYESTKGKGPLVYSPYSTGIALQMIPKASVDKVPILTMGYGLSASAIGDKFPWVFNLPSTYWSQASVIIKYIGQQEGSMEKLKGKKIAFLYLDTPYGKEPIPFLEDTAKKYGFTLVTIPVDSKEMQNQSSQWLEIRKERPDWVVMWSFGSMTPAALKEAAKINFPMDHMIGDWWASGTAEVKAVGDSAKGYKTAAFYEPNSNFPAIQDVKRYVIDKGLSISGKENFGDIYYLRGIINAAIIAEGIRTAQNLTGKKLINSEDMRKGLENLNLNQERLKKIGLEGFIKPMRVTCKEHDGGSNLIFIQQWDGKEWKRVSDWIEPMYDVVRPMLEKSADDYVKGNPNWITQQCPAK